MKAYLLFESDLSGLGNLEGAYDKPGKVLYNAKIFLQATVLFYDSRVLTETFIERFFSNTDKDDAMYVEADNGKTCIILGVTIQ